MVGWPELVEQVAGIYQALPPEQRARAGILAGNYGEAGALDLYGPAYGLPRPISGGNSLWARGYGDPPPETVILVGFERAYAERLFQSCRPVGQVKNRYGVRNEESEHHNFALCLRRAVATLARTMARHAVVPVMLLGLGSSICTASEPAQRNNRLQIRRNNDHD